jgi:glutaredoxin-like protein NrdH
LMTEATGSVQGSHNEHHVKFYGLSTCIWCKRTRQFLESQGVSFDFAYVDLFHGKEREELVAEIRRWNPATSFPTIVVDDAQCVVGYKPEQLKEALGL